MPITFDIDIDQDVLYLRGEARGKAVGEARGIENTAKVIKHLQKGTEPAVIARLLNLPIKQVEQIIAEFLNA